MPMVWETIAAGLGVRGVVMFCAFAVIEINPMNNNWNNRVSYSFFMLVILVNNIADYLIYDIAACLCRDYMQAVAEDGGRRRNT